MLKGLGSLAARALLLFAFTSPAWAADTLYINSQSGDAVGSGKQATYTDATGTFTISGTATVQGVAITYTQTSPAVSWTLHFAPPQGSALAVGNFDNVQVYPFLSPVVPALAVTDGVFCNNVSGRFVVHDFAVDGNGNVTTFAADFQQTCQGSSAPLLGAIRYNSSVPVSVDAPTADAGGKQIVTQGATVTVDGSLSEPGNGSITAYSWTQLSGPSVSFADASAVSTTFTAPNVPTGGADVVLQLEVDNSLSLSSTSTVTIHVANPADPATFLYISGDSGDYITQGQTYSFDTDQAGFTVTKPTDGQQGVVVSVDEGLADGFNLTFDAPQGQSLQLGTYDGAQNLLPIPPTIDISGNSRGCDNTMGRFTVLDLQTDGNGNITSFAADFEQHCEDAVPAARGAIRYNSTIPVDAPLADAGNAQTMVQGETVTLSGSTWTVGGDGNDITSYSWTQLSGTNVTLSDPTSATPSFTAPDEPAGGEDLEFQLTVTNSNSVSSTSTVTVHVANPADAMSLLQMDITLGDSEQTVVPLTITSSELSFTPTSLTSGMQMMIGTFFATDGWTITMSAPSSSPQLPLQPGTYDNAGGSLSMYPSLTLYNFFYGTGYFGCSGGISTSNRFVILSIQYDENGNITSLAADFDESCTGGPTLRGVLRYNSTVPLDTPEADAGVKQEAVQGATVALSGGNSYAGSATDSITAYHWAQLSGPSVTLSGANTVAPTFTAPVVPLGGADVVLRLRVTNSNGLTDTDEVTVHVFNPADPRMLLHIDSQTGDLVGKGQTVDLNDLNAIFNAETPPYPYQGNGSAKQVDVTYAQLFNQTSQWTMEFLPPLNQTLQVGAYDLAQVANISGDVMGGPGLNVTNANQACEELTGHYDILDIQTDQFGNVTSLAADFQQTCSGASGGLHGELRYNSAVPLNEPFADAGVAQQQADEGALVTLGGSNSDAGADGATIVSYQWTQVSGPNVTLSGTTGATATFTSPDVPLGGADLVFQLTVTNSDGVSSTSTVTIHVGNPNDAKTRLYLKSDVNDPVGQGQTQYMTPNNAVFTLTPILSGSSADNTMHLTVNTGSDTPYSVYLSAPQGQQMQAGTRYLLAFPRGSSPPGMSAGNSSIICGTVTGVFVVRDLQIAQNGNVTSLAADFITHCNGEPPALTGWLRYNSKVPMDTPIADAGSDQTTYSGLPVTLDGSDSRVGLGGTFSYSWKQVAAAGVPAISLSSATTLAKPMFLAPQAPAGGVTAQLALTVTSDAGITDTSTVNVTIGNENDPKTMFYYESEPGDPVGLGGTGFGAGPDIFILPNEFSSATDITFEAAGQGLGPTIGDWNLTFNKQDFTALTPGIYVVAPGSGVSMSVSNEDSNCPTPTGLFVVRDISTNSEGRIASLGVDFVQQCSGATGNLRGVLRYNSTTPVMIDAPTVYAGPNQNVNATGSVSLSGIAYPGFGDITGYQWTQVGGTRVSLSGANSAQASFAVPQSLFNGSGSVLKFQLAVRNSLGLTGTSTVTITVQEPDTNLLHLRSDAGDPIGGGTTSTLTPPDSTMKVTKVPGSNAVRALIADGAGWTLDFAAPGGQTLQIGTYSGAVLYTSRASKSPSLYVGTQPNQCKTVSGSFSVDDVQYGTGNKIDSLAVDFEQQCDGITPALHGKLRYHSSLP